MTTTVQPLQERNWQERVKEGLKDSSWVTVGWDWLQMLLGRSVDFVLWTTMVFSCYRLVPGAPQPSASVSTFMFIMQFVGLDIGGLGLNRLGQQCGLDRWSYARIVAYILIGITLATVTWSGIEHVLPAMPKEVTGWVEVVLVILRSVMTVLYGQAIHSLKAEDHRQQDRLAELEEQVAVQGVQLNSGQQEVSTLCVQLNTAQVEVDTLRAQLDGKRQELASLRETFSSGQEWQESRVRQIVETEQHRVSSLQAELESEQRITVTLRRQVNAATVDMDGLRAQLDGKQQELERVQAALDAEREAMSTLAGELSTGESTVVTLKRQLDTAQADAKGLRVQLDREREKVSTGEQEVSSDACKLDSLRVSTGHSSQQENGQGKVVRLDTTRSRKSGQDAAEQTMGEQVREVLRAEPGLSGRAIAARLGCSPTTAAKWKGIIEAEQNAVNQ